MGANPPPPSPIIMPLPGNYIGLRLDQAERFHFKLYLALIQMVSKHNNPTVSEIVESARVSKTIGVNMCPKLAKHSFDS